MLNISIFCCCCLLLERNTCYMNSSLQCLSHTISSSLLCRPAGHQHDKSFWAIRSPCTSGAVLINPLWKQSIRLVRTHSSVSHHRDRMHLSTPLRCTSNLQRSPSENSMITSKAMKHDAQELLAFLLSGLRRPQPDRGQVYIEAPDSDGRPDSELPHLRNKLPKCQHCRYLY
jgi:ubiquitin C-terminal hydrolase